MGLLDRIFSGLPLTLKDASIRATCCATILHRVIAEHPEVNGVKLSLHAGVGCGRALAHVIGGVLGRWELILTGAGVDQIKVGEPAAGPKETVVSPEVWEYCKGIFPGVVLPEFQNFVRVEPLASEDLCVRARASGLARITSFSRAHPCCRSCSGTRCMSRSPYSRSSCGRATSCSCPPTCPTRSS